MSDPDPACPDCGNLKVAKQFSASFAAHGVPGSPPSVAAAVAAAVVAAAADLSLIAYGDQVAGCTRCALAQTRTQVVFGAGSPTAELMFVGEAPGFHEDKQGVPFVGAAGKAALEAARRHRPVARGRLHRNTSNAALRETATHCPRRSRPARRTSSARSRSSSRGSSATLGNFATKLLSGKPAGITQVHGREQQVVLGGRPVTLYPIFHPAAALYTPRMLQVLEEDFRAHPRAARARPAPLPPPPEPAAGRRRRPPSSRSSSASSSLAPWSRDGVAGGDGGARRPAGGAARAG